MIAADPARDVRSACRRATTTSARSAHQPRNHQADGHEGQTPRRLQARGQLDGSPRVAAVDVEHLAVDPSTGAGREGDGLDDVFWIQDEGAEKPVTELIGAAQMDAELAKAWSETYAQPRRELARARLRSAQQVGQLREGADLDVIVDQLWGACYHRLLVLKVPFDRSIVERLVDHALYGAAPPLA